MRRIAALSRTLSSSQRCRSIPSIACRAFTRSLSSAASSQPSQPSQSSASQPANPLAFNVVSSMRRVPLNEQFAPLDLAPAHVQLNSQTGTRLTTLPSGLRVASVESASAVAALGVFIEAGSRFETDTIQGMTHFWEMLAFKSTQNRSQAQLIRDMTRLGANVMCGTSREHLMFAGDVYRAHIPDVLNVFSDSMTKHLFNEEEIAQVREQYESELKEKEKLPDHIMGEMLHETAWQGNTLGRQFFADAAKLQTFTPAVLREYARTYFTPSRMVVAGVGVDHDSFVRQVDHAFRDLPMSPAVKHEIARYTGGGSRRVGKTRDESKPSDEERVHFAIMFPSESWHSADIYTLCVLQMLMGGGSSFSSGGPGKGMYSRLYSRVLNQHGWIDSAVAMLSIYNDSSVFGIYGTAYPNDGGELVRVLVDECVAMASAVDDIALERAKRQLRSSVWMHLESRAVQLEDVGRQVLTYGRIPTATELCDKIDRVTSDDIRRVAHRMLIQPPTTCAYGDIASIPSHDLIAQRVQLGMMKLANKRQ